MHGNTGIFLSFMLLALSLSLPYRMRSVSTNSSSSGSSSQSESSDDEGLEPNSGNPDDSTTFGNTFAMGLEVTSFTEACLCSLLFSHINLRT